MSQLFDPYHKWLGIRPEEQPANHYRLLGLHAFEHDPTVIENAADQRMAHLRTVQTGQHAELSQRLLTEVVAAKLCLLDEAARSEYDAKLRRRMMGGRDPSRLSPAAVPAVIPVPRASQEAAASSSQLQPAAPTTVRTQAAALGIGAGTAVAAGARRISPAWILGGAGVVAVVLVLVALGGSLLWKYMASEETGEVVQTTIQPPPPAAMDPVKITRALPGDPDEKDGKTSGTLVLRDLDLEDGGLDDPPALVDLDESELLVDPAPNEGTAVPDRLTTRVEPANSARIGAPLPAVSRAARLPVPGVQSQREIVARLDELYPPSSYASSAKRLELAREFLELGNEPGVRSDERFVLYRRAMELACEGGDVPLMISTIDTMGEYFAFDTRAVQTKMLRRYVGDGKDSRRVLTYLKTSRKIVSDAMTAGEYQVALAASSDACRFCEQPVGNSELRQAIRDDHARIEKTHQEYERFETAHERLATTPDDAAANHAAGRWYCFVRDDWDRGLPYLADGSDERLKAAAMRDLSVSPDDVDSVIDVAEAWWELAQSHSGDERQALARRARHWYEGIAPTQLSGLSKIKVERQRGEVSELLANSTPSLWQYDGERVAAPGEPARREDVEPSDDFQTKFGQAVDSALHARDFAEAERLFGECVKMQPRHVPTLNNHALASVQTRNYRRAMELWEQAVDLDPETPELRHNLNRLRRMFDVDGIRRDASIRRELTELANRTKGSSSETYGRGWLYLPADDGRSSSGSQYEDDRCLRCNGTRTVACGVTGCTRGRVRSMRTTIVGRNPYSGEAIYQNTPVRVSCGVCGGRGEVPCPVCVPPPSRYPN